MEMTRRNFVAGAAAATATLGLAANAFADEAAEDSAEEAPADDAAAAEPEGNPGDVQNYAQTHEPPHLGRRADERH